MSQIHALLGSSAASGAGESFLWEGINELTLSSDTQYISYTVSSAPYNAYDALWFRMALRGGNSNAQGHLTVRVDGYSSANVYQDQCYWASSSGSFLFGYGNSQSYAEFRDVMTEYNDTAGRYGWVDLYVSGDRNETTYNGSQQGTANCGIQVIGGSSEGNMFQFASSTLPSQSVIGSIGTIQFGCGDVHGNGQFDTGTNVQVYGVSYG